MEKTLIILKPDAVDRRLAGEIISRFERKGLQILAIKVAEISRNIAEKHYEAHIGKSFYDGLIQFITGGPAVLMVLGGYKAVEVARKLIGATAGYEARPGTIRGDLGMSGKYNLVHGSDSLEAAEREIGLFFRPEEILDYQSGDSQWFQL